MLSRERREERGPAGFRARGPRGEGSLGGRPAAARLRTGPTPAPPGRPAAGRGSPPRRGEEACGGGSGATGPPGSGPDGQPESAPWRPPGAEGCAHEDDSRKTLGRGSGM